MSENKFNIGDIVLFEGTNLKNEPKGTCMFDWALNYCLTDEEYLIIDISESGDIRIKGKLNSNLPLGKYQDEIWVNSNQFIKLKQ